MTRHVDPHDLTPGDFDPRHGHHPRCVAMAEFMREHHGCQFRDLRAADFTTGEIAEFADPAMTLAAKLSVTEMSVRADLLADMKMKAREAIQNFRPLPRGTADGQAIYVAWGRYCAAAQSFRLDPWAGQRERCVSLLEAYFRLTSAGPAVAREIVADVEDFLAGRMMHRSAA